MEVIGLHKGIASASVQYALKKTGMSIKELSRRTGVNYHTARNGILGKTSMQSDHFLRYAEVLNIDLQQGGYFGTFGKNNTETCERIL